MERKRRLLILWIAIFSLLLCAGIVYFHGIRIGDPEGLDRVLGQNLPAGTGQAQVIVFLDSKKISHSEYVPEYHEIQAQIGKSRIGWGGGRIIIKFYSDERGKLKSHSVHELLDFL